MKLVVIQLMTLKYYIEIKYENRMEMPYPLNSYSLIIIVY